MGDWVIFSLDERPFAIALDEVSSVVNAAELTSVPLAPETFRGMLNFHGDLIPTFDLRHWLGIENREMKLSDQYIICQKQGRNFGLWVDKVTEVGFRAEIEGGSIEELDRYAGAIKFEGKAALILKIEPLFDRTEPVKL